MQTIHARSFIIPGRGALVRIPDGCRRALVTGETSLPEMARRKIRIAIPFIRFKHERFDILSHLQIAQAELDKKGGSKAWMFFLLSFAGGHPLELDKEGRPVVDMWRMTTDAGKAALIDEGRFASLLEALLRPASCGDLKKQRAKRPLREKAEDRAGVMRVPETSITA